MSVAEVVKVGGSLLAAPGGIDRVAEWLDGEQRAGETRLVIAGGGPVVEGLRRIDAANALDERASHVAAIRLMDANTRLLADWIPTLRLADLIEPLAGGDVATLILRWLLEIEPRAAGERLAIGWRTTSDAIAARLAAVHGARVTFLKHSITSTYDSLDAAAEDGVIDGEAPRTACGAAGWRLVGVFTPRVTPTFSDFCGLKLDESHARDSTA